MNQKYLTIMTRAAALSAYLQTEKDVAESHAIASKLKGEQLALHLQQNTLSILKNMKKQFREAKQDKKAKRVILQKWKDFTTEYADRWPNYLAFIETRIKKRAS
jgi:hypothetical protein